MKRIKWTFRYSAEKLAEGAEHKRKLHEDRLKFWAEKKIETVKKVGESGIEVRESVAGENYSYTNVSAHGPQITIDHGLQRDLTECQQKIKEHASKMKEYEGWVRVLKDDPHALYSLDHEDVVFFFGK